MVGFDDIPGALTHDGGRVRFGPDGLLYVTMGDNREASDAQDLAAFTGSSRTFRQQEVSDWGYRFNSSLKVSIQLPYLSILKRLISFTCETARNFRISGTRF